MKRAIYLALALALLVAPAVMAQEQPQQDQQTQTPAAKKPKPMDPADVETLTGQPFEGEAEPAPKPGHPLAGEPAPKKGHPLDMRDVDILTGKADRYNQGGFYGRAVPYVYVDVSPNASRFGSTQFGNRANTRLAPGRRAFGRRVFGRPVRGRTPVVAPVP